MSSFEAVIGVDPGLATGLARAFPAIGFEVAFTLDHLAASKWIFEAGQHYGPRLLIACEEFVPRKGVLDWMSESVEVTGVCKLVSYMFGCALNMQTPTDAKAFVSNQRLRDIGWWIVGGDDHQRDACRHILLTFARSGWYDGSKITWGGKK